MSFVHDLLCKEGGFLNAQQHYYILEHLHMYVVTNLTLTLLSKGPVTPWRSASTIALRTKKSAEGWRTLTIAGLSLCYRRVRLAIVVDRR